MILLPSTDFVCFVPSTNGAVSPTIFIVSCNQKLLSVPFGPFGPSLEGPQATRVSHTPYSPELRLVGADYHPSSLKPATSFVLDLSCMSRSSGSFGVPRRTCSDEQHTYLMPLSIMMSGMQ